MKRISVLVFTLMLASCITPLKTLPIQKVTDDEGRFNLIYLVGIKSKDIRNAIVIDRLGDEYEFVPDVRDFEYEILQDISIREALLETDVFFRSFPFIKGANLQGITDQDGNIIGYELKPFYDKKFYGVEDILDIDYTLKSDNRIGIDIGIKFGLIPRLEPDISLEAPRKETTR